VAQAVDKEMAREAKVTLKVVGGLLKKHGSRLAAEDRERIAHAVGVLESARSAGQPTAIRAALDEVERLYQMHLHRYRKSTTREYVESIGWAVVVALILRAFVIEAFKIPSGSMIPTLLIGDHIFVNKFIYGLRIPWTFYKFFEFSKPRRGDVVVFIKPDEPDKDFIKRVVGVAGDVVEIRGGDLYVNGVLQPRKEKGDYTYPEFEEYGQRWVDVRSKLYAEALGDITHDILVKYSWVPPPDSSFAVRAGTVFVMGDNRDNSSDSRSWGLVPLDHVKGRAMFIWWSMGGKDGFRFKRLFTWIK